MHKLTKEQIKRMTVAELVGLINEVNKPPGGIASLHEIVAHTFLTKKSKILEIGCNTGYSSIELRRLTGAQITGIDVVKESLEKAKRRAKEENLKITFLVLDATKMSFNEKFDLVLCSNATSFISDKKRAITSYVKALKKYGFLVAIPLYYVKNPPSEMLKELSKEIGVKITPFKRETWLKLFEDQNLELCYEKRFAFNNRTKDEISSYINEYYLDLKRKTVLKNCNKSVKDAVYKKYMKQYELFNRNLTYMNASILIYRKIPKTYEKELFRIV